MKEYKIVFVIHSQDESKVDTIYDSWESLIEKLSKSKITDLPIEIKYAARKVDK